MKHIPFSIFFFILTVFASCSDSKNDPSENINNNITFSAQVIPTKTNTTPLVPGVIVTVYAYPTGNNYPVNQGDYESLQSSALTGIDSYIMYLPNGTYNFYSISTNDKDMTQALHNNQITDLHNKTDYLWAMNTNELIQNSTKNIAIVLKHIACQIGIKMVAGPGITINSIDSAFIQMPDTSGVINLLSGQISQAPLSADSAKMEIIGNTAKSIILPTSANSISFYVYLKINGESYSIPYKALIAAPSGGLTSGNFYEYTAVINLENMVFSAYNVYDWNTKDLTGDPIYPEE